MKRFALALLALGAFAPAASAGVPDPRYSSFTPVLVGDASGDPIAVKVAPLGVSGPSLGFMVNVRDVGNAPQHGATAILDFQGTGLRPYLEQESGTTVDCAQGFIEKLCDSHGIAVLHPRFGGFTTGAPVVILGSGVVLGEVPARSTDMDGQGGSTGLGDFTLFAPLFLGASTAHPEADFDASGGPIGLGDFTIFAREFLSGAHGTYCP